eukprot:TRINITY_DN7041_c0_g1_i1.p1 TRINITY_DN7041_c0_g1~~TRINITY_DN7041_c0_g1_i1.p1  ORF type:complete len:248 (+),score=29.43 TRINITY_DN7041_c0_g1_i1:43-744(+)
MSTVLPVHGELSPEIGPPSDGVEYLMQVRWEARRTMARLAQAPARGGSSGAVDNADTSNNAHTVHTAHTTSDVDTNAASDSAWTVHCTSQFAELRRRVARALECGERPKNPAIPHANDSVSWIRIVRGDRGPPRLSLLQSVGPMLARSALEHTGDTIRDEANGLALLERESSGAWIYALLACVDEPLLADTAAALTAILRAIESLSARQTPLPPHIAVLQTILRHTFRIRASN